MAHRCRVCESNDLFEVLDLGHMPLAGDFRPIGEANALYPLAIDGCRSCGVLQVRETVALSLLFGPAYSYAASTVPGLVKHFERYAHDVALSDGTHKSLLEIGCNDGIFLLPLREKGYQVVGIDASDNVAAMAREKGLDVHTGFFDITQALRLLAKYGPFDVVTCSNVFAHNPQVNEFVEAVRVLLHPEHGSFWVEVHSANRLFEALQWDCFYHEHCFYWTIHALQRCLRRHGLNLQRYVSTEMHGGALRAIFSAGNRTKVTIEDKEISPGEWECFRQRCLHNRNLVRECISTLPIHYAYGAAGRAVTLINWTGIGSYLDFVVDGSPLRSGKAIPNTMVPIISEQAFFQEKGSGEWCFVTAHNYLPDIRTKVSKAFPGKNVKFVVPLPDVRVT